MKRLSTLLSNYLLSKVRTKILFQFNNTDDGDNLKTFRLIK